MTPPDPHDHRPEEVHDDPEAEQHIDKLERRIQELEAENERLRREQKYMLLSVLSRTGRAEGKMRKMQEDGTDPLHSRLLEGRYEALSGVLGVLSDIASAGISKAAPNEAEGPQND